jgi:hypothetical protein
MEATASTMRSAAHRFGGGLLLAGTISWLLLSGLHGDLPGTGHQEVTQALRPFWRPIHLLTIVAIATVAAGLAVLAGTLAAPRAAVLGRAGAAFLVPAGAVLGVGYAIDGFVLAAVAEAYAAAPDEAGRTTALMPAGLALNVIAATSFTFQTLFGLALAMIAGATVLSGEYPRAVCRAGVIGGAGWVLAGVLLFSKAPGVGSWVILLPVVPVAVWLLTVGWLAWRRGDAITASAVPGTPMR